jgi:hypothetical protein
MYVLYPTGLSSLIIYILLYSLSYGGFSWFNISIAYRILKPVEITIRRGLRVKGEKWRE